MKFVMGMEFYDDQGRQKIAIGAWWAGAVVVVVVVGSSNNTAARRPALLQRACTLHAVEPGKHLAAAVRSLPSGHQQPSYLPLICLAPFFCCTPAAAAATPAALLPIYSPASPLPAPLAAAPCCCSPGPLLQHEGWHPARVHPAKDAGGQAGAARRGAAGGWVGWRAGGWLCTSCWFSSGALHGVLLLCGWKRGVCS
jgi:hypothetical protein